MERDRQQNTRRQLNWTAGAARTRLGGWTQRPSGAAVRRRLERWRGVYPDDAKQCFPRIGIRMRKI